MVEKDGDQYHTLDELYDYRMVYNALIFNEWAKAGCYDVHKSWRHSDGEECFGGGWFIVSAETPYGQSTNNYPEKDWHRFLIPERTTANAYDGHTSGEALSRLKNLLDVGHL